MNAAQRKKMELELKKDINKSYKIGEQNGFDRCVPSVFYTIMKITNSKNKGLNKLWNEVREIDRDLKDNKSITHLEYADIYQFLFEELNIVLNADTARQAAEISSNPNGKNKKQLEQLKLSLRRYREFREFFMEFSIDEQVKPGTPKHERDRMETLYRAYKKGEADGFFRCLCIVLYAVYNTTSYKHHGIFSILNKTFFLDNAMETEGSIITMDLINLALLEETGIICYTAFKPTAEEYLKEFQASGEKKGYAEELDSALEAYIEGFYID